MTVVAQALVTALAALRAEVVLVEQVDTATFFMVPRRGERASFALAAARRRGKGVYEV